MVCRPVWTQGRGSVRRCARWFRLDNEFRRQLAADALCGRRGVAANDAQRTKAQEELQSKQLEMLAQRHMRNLRQDAHIEHR